MKKVGQAAVILIALTSCLAGIFITQSPKVSAYTPHNPISIEGNADFAQQAANEGWPGDGSEGNPYVIEGFEINAEESDGISIESTRVYFIIRNSQIRGGTIEEDYDTYNQGIYLGDVTNGTITNCIIEDNWNGINIISSSDNIVHNNILSSNLGDGINILSSSRQTVFNNTLINNGIQIYGSDLDHWMSHIMDTSNTINEKPLIYWKDIDSAIVPPEVGQVILVNCTDVKVEKQEFINVSIGIQLFCSSNNTISSNIASYNS
ncbi:MAG: right-handed parallel beta-helix repeat-containing protein, partial [Thermoplasmata archaeon]